MFDGGGQGVGGGTQEQTPETQLICIHNICLGQWPEWVVDGGWWVTSSRTCRTLRLSLDGVQYRRNADQEAGMARPESCEMQNKK